MSSLLPLYPEVVFCYSWGTSIPLLSLAPFPFFLVLYLPLLSLTLCPMSLWDKLISFVLKTWSFSTNTESFNYSTTELSLQLSFNFLMLTHGCANLLRMAGNYSTA